jgi:hypothetical protein
MAALSAAPVAGQLWGFPDYSVPSAQDGAASYLTATYGRGLNDLSGKLDAFGAVFSRATDPVSFSAGLGYVKGPAGADGEITVGGAISADVAPVGTAGRLSIQGGVGWMDAGSTQLRFPIGVALKGHIESTSSTVSPWIMPRLDITRVSVLGISATETDFGASGGVLLAMNSGFGVHTALDVAFRNGGKVWSVGVGAHYQLGN